MATPVKSPSTPKAPQTPASGAGTPTGRWRHPHLDEINRRVRKSTFNDANVNRIVWNALSLLATIVVPHLLHFVLPSLVALLRRNVPYSGYLNLALQLLFTFNIACAFWPLFRKPDDLSDIPLTPSQRSLLGLPQTATPLTPGSHYITPPRYARSASGSRQGSPLSSSRDTVRGQLDGQHSPLAAAARATSSQLPPSGSPLFRKATDSATRRQSFDSPSAMTRSGVLALDSSAMTGIGSVPGSPTPAGIGGKGPSVQLNSKWLYERTNSGSGRRSPFA